MARRLSQWRPRVVLAAMVLGMGVWWAWDIFAPDDPNSWRQRNVRRTYDYSLSGSGPWNYPPETIDATLLLADGTRVTMPKRRPDNGWGEEDGVYVVGANRKAVPVGVRFAWYSYAEDKFYGGEMTWPGEPVDALLHAGTPMPDGSRGEYSNAMLGFAPGGYFTVWMLGPHRWVAIAEGTLPEIEMDWSVMGFTRKGATRESSRLALMQGKHGRKSAAQIADEGIPLGRWQRYARRYNWTMEPIGSPLIQRSSVSALNGERFPINADGSTVIEGPQALPRKLSVKWRGKADKPHLAYLYFQPDEIMEAAELLATDGRPLTLRVDTSAIAFAVDAYLHDGQRTVHLEETRISRKASERYLSIPEQTGH